MKRTSFRRPTPAEARRTLRQRDQRRLAKLQEKRRRSSNGRPKKRPGTWTPSGPGWKGLVAQVRERDQRCRRCGGPVLDVFAVDHIWPRRIAPPDELDRLENLALLDRHCHGVKGRGERRMFLLGKPWEFRRFLTGLALTGPVPGADFQARALARLAELVYGQATRETVHGRIS